MKSQDQRTKSPQLGSECNNDTDEFLAFACLPVGADSIIRQMAAEQILAELLDKVNTRNTVDYEVIYNVVTEFPGTCHKAYDVVWEDGSKRRLLPLSIICSLGPNLRTVQAIYHANPSAIFLEEPFKKALPLHLACAFEASLDVVEFLHGHNIKAIETPRIDGALPIHLASAFYKGEPSVLNFLIDKYPKSANQLCNSLSWSPLHSSCHGGVADVAILKRMHELAPSIIGLQDRHGRTPLHLACRSRNGNEKAIEFLVRAAPDSLMVHDGFDQWTPLFLACIHQNAETIETLLDLIPQVAPHGVVDPNTNHGPASILHWAAIGNNAEAVKYLATRFPEMLQRRTSDDEQDTPLSWAVANRASKENIQILIQLYPKALLMKDGSGQLPADSAKRNRAGKDIIELLKKETSAISREVVERSRFAPNLD